MITTLVTYSISSILLITIIVYFPPGNNGEVGNDTNDITRSNESNKYRLLSIRHTTRLIITITNYRV